MSKKIPALKGCFGGLPLRHLAFSVRVHDVIHRRKGLSGPVPRRERAHASGLANLIATFEATAVTFTTEEPPFGEARYAAQDAHLYLANTNQNQPKPNRRHFADAPS